MAHFAELDQDDIVVSVLVVHNEELLDSGVESEQKGIDFLQSLYGHRNWRQTSYNGRIRKNYASEGFRYDVALDAFIAPQPFPSWTLDQASCRWQAPIAYPQDGRHYIWNEHAFAWEPVTTQ